MNEWDKVYCKTCGKYLGRLDPKCCYCDSECQAGKDPLDEIFVITTNKVGDKNGN